MAKRVIHKYKVSLYPECQLYLVKGSTVLSFGWQESELFVWVERPAGKEYDNDLEKVSFLIVGTGHEFNDVPCKFINSAFKPGLVLHFYQLT